MPAVPVIALVVSAVGAYASYTQQQKAEKKADEAARKQEEANRLAAEREAELLRIQAADEIRAGEEEADRIRKNAQRVKSAQLAGLGGAGVKIGEGTASDLLMETDKLSELDALAALKDSTGRANLLQKKGSNLLATDYSVTRPPRTSSLLATGLNVASTGLSAYSSYKGSQNRTNLLAASSNRSAGASAGVGG